MRAQAVRAAAPAAHNSQPRRVLLLGGYGTFGSRIAERSAARGFEVLVAGRSREKAEAICAGRRNMVPLAVDRDVDLAKAIAQHRPFAVVDAAGPFQGANYDVARAAIAGGSHYLDIADSTAFVTGIGAMDGEARAKGVAAISGASSVPALSGAVARRLSEGLTRVSLVDMALSASSKGTAGRSVTAALLSYVGRRIPLFRGGRWTHAYGWQELRSMDFAVQGERPLRRRLVGMADVPDLRLLPARLPGHPSVSFAAGTDMPWQNLGVWLLSWLVRSGVWRHPERQAEVFATLQRLTRGPGSDRSAFSVRVCGTDEQQRRLERTWTLMVSKYHGPEIPTLAVPILLDKLASGAIEPGARDAGTLLTLDDFRASFESLASAACSTERERPHSLYSRVMGEEFARLPTAVQEMHQVFGDNGAEGEVFVERGTNPIANFAAAVTGFPVSGHHKLHVSFSERDGRERWVRESSSGQAFSSRLYEHKGRLAESFFGIAHFGFDLSAEQNGLRMHLARWWLGPVPMPRVLGPRCTAREWEEDGKFHFDVPIELPVVGLVVHYRGWLKRITAPPPAEVTKANAT